MRKAKTIVFTDLDGTLIDFETYSSEIAAPLARKVADRGVPLVFCSSKTLEEQLSLMQEMGLTTPCIVENGSGIFIPSSLPATILSDLPGRTLSGLGRLATLGVSSSVIQKTIRKLSDEMGIDFRPYSSLTSRAMAKITGLSEEAAHRARHRDFSETLTARLDDDAWSEVNSRLKAVGLQCLCGGRFYTVTSIDCDKGKAMNTLVEAYRSQYGGDWKTVGIGDSANDFDMLAAADQGYLVQQPDGSWKEMEIPRLIKVPQIGPRGWVQAVKQATGIRP